MGRERWGGSGISLRVPYFFFTRSLQNRTKIGLPIQIAKINHSYLARTVKERRLDARVLGVLNRYFPIVLYSIFFILRGM